MSAMVQFVLARVAEDEERARLAADAAEGGLWFITPAGPPSGELFSVSPNVGYAMNYDVGDHVARWNPRRILHECAAKREQVAQATELGIEPERVARTMAVVWADHPEFDQGWRL